MIKKLMITFISIVILIVILVNMSGNSSEIIALPDTANNSNNKFAIWTSDIDGTNIRKLTSDSYRQMTHIRISPDKKWFMFTRYNNVGKNGCATEAPDNYNNKGENYIETEILLGNLETLEIKSLVKPEQKQMSANSYWNSEGNKMLYVHVPQNEKKPQINIASFDQNKNIIKTEKLSLPDYLLPVDPQQVGNKIVFPAVDIRKKTRGLWLINSDGSGLKQITFPKDPKTGKIITVDRGGDNDPKISPDGKHVAFMRNVKGRYHWHIIIVDLNTGLEKDLSQGLINDIFEADAVPEWTSDSKLIGFWHINAFPFNKGISIGVINPDGTERKTIKLPDGYNYQSIAFFPGERSDSTPGIIFGAEKRNLKCSIP